MFAPPDKDHDFVTFRAPAKGTIQAMYTTRSNLLTMATMTGEHALELWANKAFAGDLYHTKDISGTIYIMRINV